MTLNKPSLLVFDELCVYLSAGKWHVPNHAGACHRDRAGAIGPVSENERGIGLLLMDGPGHGLFAVGRDGADNYVRPARELAWRIEGGLVNHFDVTARLGLPILLLADVRGETVPGAAAAEN